MTSALAERYDGLLKLWHDLHNEHRFRVEWYSGMAIHFREAL